jgi:hypothetical protein
LTNTQVHELTKINNVIYASTDGGVFCTNNGGASWSLVSKIFASSFVMSIAVNRNAVFAGTWGDGVFRYNGSDTNWIAINNGLTNRYIESLVVIYSNVFAGTDRGVFLSTDNGNSWLIADSSLSGKYIKSLSVSGGNLIAGTSSNGVWRRTLSDMITGIKYKYSDIPQIFTLQQNFPNPFNPNTTISFSLPSKSYVLLRVYDVLGREVATIISEDISAGNYSRRWNAANISSGIYFYRLQADSFTETKKMILLK